MELIEKILAGLENQTSLKKYSEKLLSNIAKEFEIVQGLFFLKNPDTESFKPIATYAYYSEKKIIEFKTGEGLSGQVAKNKKIMNISNIPENFITILSGTGQGSPNHLILLPVLYKNKCIGVLELASFKKFDSSFEQICKEISQTIGKNIINFKYK